MGLLFPMCCPLDDSMGDAGNPDTCCLSYFPKGCSFQNPHHHHQSVRNCLQLGRHETASDPCQNQGNGACLNSLRSQVPQNRPVNSQKMGRLEEEHCLESCQKTWDLWERWKSLSLYTKLPVIHLCAGTMHTTADNRLHNRSLKGCPIGPIGPIAWGGSGFALGMAEPVRREATSRHSQPQATSYQDFLCISFTYENP